jgi:Arc/MetJ-type ribon-helix-helix transcriptional regulator
MPLMTTQDRAKRDFATRLSRETLTRLDQRVPSGRFKTRTAAIEAAVDRLFDAEQQQEQLQEAFDRACGALNLGVDRERWRQAELDRLDWGAGKTDCAWRNRVARISAGIGSLVGGSRWHVTE